LRSRFSDPSGRVVEAAQPLLPVLFDEQGWADV
jgi:hypothetical protein